MKIKLVVLSKLQSGKERWTILLKGGSVWDREPVAILELLLTSTAEADTFEVGSTVEMEVQ